MSRWMAISAYTVGTPYEEEAKNLEQSLKDNKVPYKLYSYESQGDWEINCLQKGRIILKAFNELKRNLVWLDADAEVLKYPELFDTYKYDIGLYRRWHTPEQQRELGTLYHWDTGTMFLKNTASIHKLVTTQQSFLFVAQAVGLVEAGLDWTLMGFNHFISRIARDGVNSPTGIRVGQLPVTYSYIANTKQPEELKYKRKVVIRHHQASRRLKEIIDEGSVSDNGI